MENSLQTQPYTEERWREPGVPNTPLSGSGVPPVTPHGREVGDDEPPMAGLIFSSSVRPASTQLRIVSPRPQTIRRLGSPLRTKNREPPRPEESPQRSPRQPRSRPGHRHAPPGVRDGSTGHRHRPSPDHGLAHVPAKPTTPKRLPPIIPCASASPFHFVQSDGSGEPEPAPVSSKTRVLAHLPREVPLHPGIPRRRFAWTSAFMASRASASLT